MPLLTHVQHPGFTYSRLCTYTFENFCCISEQIIGLGLQHSRHQRHVDYSLQNKGSVPHYCHHRDGPSQKADQPIPGEPSHGLRSKMNNCNKSRKHSKRSLGDSNSTSNRANSHSHLSGGKYVLI